MVSKEHIMFVTTFMYTYNRMCFDNLFWFTDFAVGLLKVACLYGLSDSVICHSSSTLRYTQAQMCVVSSSGCYPDF